MIKNVLESYKKEKALFLIAAIVFLAFVGVGIVAGTQSTDMIEKLLNQFLAKRFEGILKNVNNNFELSLAILKNNMIVYLITITIGTLTFGLVSLLVLISNGIIVGLVIPINIKKSSLLHTLLLLLPHGVIEIFGFITGAVASWLFLVHFIKSKEKTGIKPVLKTYLTLSISGAILLIIAAFIEGYITASFAK